MLPTFPATRRTGAAGINRVMTRIQNAILARGYVTTRVLAETLDLQSGVLVLTVIPGRIHAIRFTDDSGPRANAWNTAPARPGDLLNLRDIEPALENFKRVPTAEADIQIVPADQPGESDLLISWKQAFALVFRPTMAAHARPKKIPGQCHRFRRSPAGAQRPLLRQFHHDLGGGGASERGRHGHTLHYSLPWGLDVAGSSQTYLF